MQLPMAERLTANALHCAFLGNLRARAITSRPSRPPGDEVDAMLYNDPALDSLVQSAFGGAARLLTAAFLLKTRMSLNELVCRPVADYFTADELRVLVSPKTARQAARARMDQIGLDSLRGHASLVNGELALAPFSNPAGPLPLPDVDGPVFLHETTYACAALATRVVDAKGDKVSPVTLSTPILVEILILAQRLLSGQQEQ
jgi:hypothetical protein